MAPVKPTPRVLIADELSPRALEIFRERGVAADFRPGLPPAELEATIADYDGLAVRSATKVTAALLAKAGMTASELLAKGPVGGRSPALEQSGLGQEERAGADRAGPARALGHPPERWNEPRVPEDVADPQAAADDHGVDAATPHLAERNVGAEAQSPRAANGLAVGGRDDHAVAAAATKEAGRRVEDVGRADDVEELHSVEGDQHDLALGGRHRHILQVSASVRKDVYPSNSDKDRSRPLQRW